MAAFVDIAKPQPIDGSEPLSITLEKLIKNEFKGIIDDFFAFVKEIVKTVTEEEDSGKNAMPVDPDAGGNEEEKKSEEHEAEEKSEEHEAEQKSEEHEAEEKSEEHEVEENLEEHEVDENSEHEVDENSELNELKENEQAET